MRWGAPGRALDPLVRSIWSLAGPRDTASLPGIVVPDTHVEFVFHLQDPWRSQRLGDAGWVLQPVAFVHCTCRGALRFAAGARVDVIAFRVSPVVARCILRRSIADLWDAPVALDTLIGASEAGSLLERLHRVAPDDRFRVIRDWIADRLHDWNADDWKAQRMFGSLLWRARIGSMATISRSFGPSARSLRRTLAAHAGISPKALQLSGRLLEGCALLRENAAMEITEAACRAGFYDHAAFTHCFTDRFGLTPTQLRAEPVVFYEREHAGPVGAAQGA